MVRGLYIATQAHDTFTRLVAGSLVLTFFVYTFVNIGMVTGLPRGRSAYRWSAMAAGAMVR